MQYVLVILEASLKLICNDTDTADTVLLSKKVNNYQCIVYSVWLLQIFRVKFACILFSLGAQLDGWTIYISSGRLSSPFIGLQYAKISKNC